MPRVFIPPQMRDLTAGESEVTVDGATLRQVFAALDARFPGLGARLHDSERFASGLAVAIDGVVTSRGLLTRVGPQSEVHFLPAIGGG
jgi:molybdopterin synthase sulfur carrier subunit